VVLTTVDSQAVRVERGTGSVFAGDYLVCLRFDHDGG
jgi:hypothetical protein